MVEPGAVVWFTGVPASGKSTVATAVEEKLRAMGCLVENLDADEVRQNLSPNLGFTPEARDENTKRLAWMGKILSRNGVTVLIAAVAPMRYYRDRAREWCPRFVEVWTTAPFEICKERDPKGLYARGERGEINDIAGWHQPYEEPENAEVVLPTHEFDLETCANMVIAKLKELGYLSCAGGCGCGCDDGYTAEEQAKVEERLKDLGYM
ncbi:MAG: adenylyl-sulfate kinase [Armatimonadetes bacterium]|jgi:adenylyl-sulfate kinase|nr:adenylyl-sulfate kinase [Armatimonadota bacterium]MDI9586912.1 adenylyl-sulfate kinase [Acidobacteriota bacterium]